MNREAAAVLTDAGWLTPFGSGIRYTGGLPKMLPGDETRGIEIALAVKAAALRILNAE